MIKRLKLSLALAVFTPAWALLGAFSTLDGPLPVWSGLAAGGLIGVFFGLVFGGNRKWKFWDQIFGREDQELYD